MADPSFPLDPFAMWREMVSQWEKGANQLGNETTATDAFTGAMHKAMAAGVTAKKVSDEASKRYLVALNLPSRADVEALGERLLLIEDRLIAISAAIEQITGTAVMAPSTTIAPRRTKKAPTDTPVEAPLPPPVVAKKKSRRVRR